MVCSHVRSRVMVVPRKRKESTVEMVSPSTTRGGWRHRVPPKVYDHLHCLLEVKHQVVVLTPGYQPVDLPPVLRFISTGDEPGAMMVVSSTNSMSWMNSWLVVQSLVYREKSSGESTQP